MNNQHLYCSLQLDFLLHSNFQIEKDTFAPAGIGTGTGYKTTNPYFAHLTEELNHRAVSSYGIGPVFFLHLVGFLISTSPLPIHHKELPANIFFDKLNIFEPVPSI